jgi:hypothetical protein
LFFEVICGYGKYIRLLVVTVLMAHQPVPCNSQQVYTNGLLKADEFYIRRDYVPAVKLYEEYLNKHPRDYFASRQAARCYERMGNYYEACEHWPRVVENTEATDKDYFDFARSLLTNDRLNDARRVFRLLTKSSDKMIAELSRDYLNVGSFPGIDVFPVQYNTNIASESNPVIYKGKILFLGDSRQTMRIFSPPAQPNTQFVHAMNLKDSVSAEPTDLYNSLLKLGIYGQFCITADGSSLYFCKAVSGKDLDPKNKPPYARYQLFILDMGTLNLDKPVIRPFLHNTAEFDLIHPCLSADGNTLYFASDMKGSMGGKDIFFCIKGKDDWELPKNAGAQVNSPGNEVYPHVSGNGDLYFSSDLRPGFGGLDVFVSERDSSGALKKFRNVGAMVNSRYDDFGIFVLPEGKTGYFTSNRRGEGDDDLFYFRKTELH